MIKTGKMEANNVKWSYAPSNSIGGGPPRKTHRQSIYIRCACGNSWTATGGRTPGPAGSFHEHMGGVSVTCPQCGMKHQFSDAETM